MGRCASTAAAAILWSLLLPVTAATAASVKGVSFPDTVTIDGREVRINGLGVRKKLFISVYAGALYLASPTHDAREAIDSEEPKRLAMHFIHSKVGAEQLREAWDEGFRNNSGPQMAALGDRIARFLSFFDEDMHSGETMAVTWRPGVGTEVEVKGKMKGTIEGTDFMKAVFAIWLGDKPADKGLKEGLLK